MVRADSTESAITKLFQLTPNWVLGDGGFGTVQEWSDTTGETYAVKLPRVDSKCTNFHPRECKALEFQTSPNIVKTYYAVIKDTSNDSYITVNNYPEALRLIRENKELEVAAFQHN